MTSITIQLDDQMAKELEKLSKSRHAPTETVIIDVVRQGLEVESRIDQDQLAEAVRRAEAYDRGELESVDAKEAMKRVRKLIKR